MTVRILPEPVVRCKAEMDADRRRAVEGLWLWCPGCDDLHRVVTWRADGGGVWTWDGDMVRPTISPSIHVGGVQWSSESKFHRRNHAAVPVGAPTVCHSFVRAGVWEFLGDCTHTLAGQTVRAVPYSEWGVKP